MFLQNMHNPLVKLYDFTVISGGQTGVDIAALRAAQCLGLKTGGMAPKGYKTIAGPKAGLKTTFRLKESNGGYSVRTRYNVEHSNATLIMASKMDSHGTALTLVCAKVSERPTFCFQIAEPQNGQISIDPNMINNCIGWITSMLKPDQDFILNVAGNSSTTSPNIFIPAFVLCTEIFAQVAFKTNEIIESELVERYQKCRTDFQMVQALADNYDYIGDLDPRGLRGLIL